jgi:exopolysaccharide biosynthesis polyprenyl glycosylphosphotransferase
VHGTHAVEAQGDDETPTVGDIETRPGFATAHRADVADVTSLAPKPPSWRDSRLRRLLAVADAGAIALCWTIAVLAVPLHAPLTSKAFLIGILPLWILLNKLLGLYDRDANVIRKSTLDELPRIAHSVVLGSSMLFLLGPLLPGVEVSRARTLVFVGVALVVMPSLRTGVRAAFSRTSELERCLIVGSGTVARLLARKLSQHPEFRVDLVGFVDEASVHADPEPGDPALVGRLDEFETLCHDLDVERVIIAFSSASHEDLLRVVRVAKQLNLKVTVVPRLFEGIGDAVEIEQVEGLTLLGLRGLGRTKSSLFLKRSLDVAVAGTSLVLLAPVLGLVALAVKITSPGPVMFRQRRIGHRDRPFTMLKFRTMRDGADELKEELRHLNEAEGPMFKIADDPRLTPVGGFLRRYSLDELPQLWNVLRGEMSLVGPRPLVPDESEQVLGRHRSRLDLAPGVTGPWQVMGRTAIPFAEMVKLDYLYVAEWSLWNDVKLLLRTVQVVVEGSGR